MLTKILGLALISLVSIPGSAIAQVNSLDIPFLTQVNNTLSNQENPWYYITDASKIEHGKSLCRWLTSGYPYSIYLESVNKFPASLKYTDEKKKQYLDFIQITDKAAVTFYCPEFKNLVLKEK